MHLLNSLTLLQLLLYFFVGVSIIQIIYWLLFWIAFSRKDQKLQASLQPVYPPVSIIVCAHDEEANLKTLVPLLLQQDYPDFEVVIVNDRSNDATYDWLLEETKRESRLRMVQVEETPSTMNAKKYALTLGIKAAKHEWLLLTDADCRPMEPSWIKTMSQAFTTETIFVLGYSPYTKSEGMLNRFIRFETLLTGIQYIAFALMGNPYMGVGRNLAYRKSFFLNVKGFNTLLPITGGDDDLFVNRHSKAENTQVVIGKGAIVESAPQTTWKNFWNQKLRHLSVGKYYRFKHRVLLGVFAITWMLYWFTIPLLLVTQTELIIIGVAFLLRQLIMVFAVNKAADRLGYGFELAALPVLDFMYAFYYLVAGLMALVSKKVRWKN